MDKDYIRDYTILEQVAAYQLNATTLQKEAFKAETALSLMN